MRVGAAGPVTGTGASPAIHGASTWPRSTQVPTLVGGTWISGAAALPATAAGLPRSGHLADHVPGEAQPASRAAPARVASASAPRVNVGV